MIGFFTTTVLWLTNHFCNFSCTWRYSKIPVGSALFSDLGKILAMDRGDIKNSGFLWLCHSINMLGILCNFLQLYYRIQISCLVPQLIIHFSWDWSFSLPLFRPIYVFFFNLFIFLGGGNAFLSSLGFYYIFYLFIFIVVQVHLYSIFTTPHPLPHPSPPPILEPTPFSYVHVSFMHVPGWPFPYCPHYPFPPTPLVTVSLFFMSMPLVVVCLLVWLVD